MTVTGLPYTLTHHISLLREDGIVKTFQGHPFVGHLHIDSIVLSEVAGSIDVLSQTKVPHPDAPSRVQPIYRNVQDETTLKHTVMLNTYITSVLLTLDTIQ